jgi:hypothetical protein
VIHSSTLTEIRIESPSKVRGSFTRFLADTNHAAEYNVSSVRAELAVEEENSVENPIHPVPPSEFIRRGLDLQEKL